jgi:23S rRNA (adenine2030-N6)-methyltransferase
VNYRHVFHAGNFADVLKHTVLLELLRLLTAKDKKLFVLDTHAGAGGYDLSGKDAARTGEAALGLARAVEAAKAGAPPAVARYLAAVMAYDRKFAARGHYPGSPRLIRAALRPGDRFVACELHPADSLALKREFSGDKAVEVRVADGYQAIKALLPPPERRGLVMIDPPFEVIDEFERLQRALRQGLRRFATGCYAVWYPIKDARAVEAFVAAFADEKWLRLELGVAPSAPGKLGDCGMLVINPPWKFDAAMLAAMPWIAKALGGRASVSGSQASATALA